MRKSAVDNRRTLLATIVALAWPTIVEQVMQTAVQYVDTAMVGALGTEATAAVGSTGTVGWMIVSTYFALGVGFLSLVAKACGAGDEGKARHVAAQSVLVVLISGVIGTVLCCGISRSVPVWMRVDPAIRPMAGTYFLIIYLPMLPRAASVIFGTILRAAGDTKSPMKVGVIVNAINVVLNYLLIFPSHTASLFGLSLPVWGAGWGVVGAAVASAASFVWGGLHMTVILWRHPMVSPRGMSLKPDGAILKPSFQIALPNMLQRVLTTLGFVFFGSMINSLGGLSTATHTIANTVESAFYIPGYGMQTAAATLAGNAAGARDKKRMISLSHLFIPLEIGLMILSGAALYFSAPVLVGIFSRDEEVIALGTRVLRMVALSEPFYGFSIIVEGMMMGVGKTREPFLFNIIGMWTVRIIGTYICTQRLGYGLTSAWACMIAHNILVCILYLITYLRGSWNPLNDKTPTAS